MRYRIQLADGRQMFAAGNDVLRTTRQGCRIFNIRVDCLTGKPYPSIPVAGRADEFPGVKVGIVSIERDEGGAA